MIKTCFLTLLICCGMYAAPGQRVEYKHQVIGTRDGLNSSKIFALYQDTQKQLWIGTEQGISRYNGYDFLNIQYSEQKKQIGRVLAITADKMGNLWIGGDNGLFHLSNNIVRQFPFGDKPGYVVETLLTDASGNIWIGGYDGLHKIAAAQAAAFYGGNSPQPYSPQKLKLNLRVFSLATDRQENIYIATSYGIYFIAKNTTALTTLWTNPNPYNYIRSVAAFSKDSVYWNLYDSAPMRLLNGELDSLPHPAFTGRNVFVHNGAAYALTTSGVAEIGGKNMRPILSFENISNLVYASLVDVEGNFWLGSWEGLIKYTKNPFSLYQLQHPLNTDAFSLLETRDSQLLVGGNRGRIFTLKNNAIVPHTSFPLLFEKAEVMTMYQHTDGSYWFGSGYQGISRFKNNKLRNWNGRTDELQNNNCESILDAGDGKLFACTEKGVTIIDPAKENAITGFLPFKTSYAIYPELFGGIAPVKGSWYFYGSSGMYKAQNAVLNNDSIRGFPYSSLYINKIIADKRGYCWIATLGHGLLKCSYTNGSWQLIKQYNKSAGLLSNDILSVLADKNDDIWLADYMSLTLIKKSSTGESVFHFNEKDGLLSSYYQSLKLEQQKNGRIWGITSMGLFSFHPDSITRNNLPPSLQMDSVIIQSANDAMRIIITAYDPTKSYRFKYFQNSIQFNFTAISLTDPSKTRYAYRVPQLDSNWSITANRFAELKFLPPGSYDFEVKAANNNDVWTPVLIKFHFTIVPPFWKTAWFIALMIAMISLLIFVWVRQRIKRVRKREALKQQLAELEGKALRAQMNPHFIFNSLNAIQECVVSGQIDTAYDYLSRFSKLLRMVLNNSEKELISLQEEMDMLSIYLQLESLRFKENFNFEINIAENIEPEMSMVPPLLLQPYIENAIWHGLMHKEGEKKLVIECREQAAMLYCIITDNGIGRKRSAAIKAGKLGAANFESKGMKLSEQRMDMMNVRKEERYSVNITDLEDEAGNAAGTRVELALPQSNH